MCRRVSRREQFLQAMDRDDPLGAVGGFDRALLVLDAAGKRGRKAKPLETMLRMYLLQTWFSLSDEGVEDAVYGSYAMRGFMGLNFTVEQVPDATTLLHFRHLLEEHRLGEKLFAAQNGIFDEQGCIMRGGSIVDTTIIATPSSTKNATGTRDPQMHQTKKGNQWGWSEFLASAASALGEHLDVLLDASPAGPTTSPWAWRGPNNVALNPVRPRCVRVAHWLCVEGGDVGDRDAPGRRTGRIHVGHRHPHAHLRAGTERGLDRGPAVSGVRSGHGHGHRPGSHRGRFPRSAADRP